MALSLARTRETRPAISSACNYKMGIMGAGIPLPSSTDERAHNRMAMLCLFAPICIRLDDDEHAWIAQQRQKPAGSRGLAVRRSAVVSHRSSRPYARRGVLSEPTPSPQCTSSPTQLWTFPKSAMENTRQECLAHPLFI